VVFIVRCVTAEISTGHERDMLNCYSTGDKYVYRYFSAISRTLEYLQGSSGCGLVSLLLF